MKKIMVILTAALLLGINVFAQNGKSIYNKYSEAENVSAVYISPTMFRLIKRLPDMNINDEGINLTNVVKSLDGLYIISSENESINENIRRDAEKFVNAGKYELLMEAKDNGEVVHIYITGKDDLIASFVLIATEPGECSFICLDGQISRQELEKLIADNM